MKDISKYINEQKDNMISSLIELINIPSVQGEPSAGAPYGVEVRRALDYAVSLGDQLGLKTFLKDGYYGWVEIGKGKPLGAILVHLDVVPAGENWTHPPFEGSISDGKIFGRGTEDNKGPAVASIFALASIQNSDIRLKGRIRVILGTNEETGWGGVEYYKKYDEIPGYGFTPDAQFPLIYAEKEVIRVNFSTEFKSDIILSIKGGSAVNMVPDKVETVLKENHNISEIEKVIKRLKCKANMSKVNEEITLTTFGTSAHASRPENGINAITCLVEILNNFIPKHDSLYKFISFYNKKINDEINGMSLGIDFEDFSGKLTFNPGIIETTEGELKLQVDIRSPVTIDPDTVVDKIRTNTPYYIDVKKEKGIKGLHVPQDSKLVQTLLKSYRNITGDNTPPLSIGGGTYARAFENTVAYGIIFPGKEMLAHQKDEYIKITDLLKITEIISESAVSLDEVM